MKIAKRSLAVFAFLGCLGHAQAGLIYDLELKIPGANQEVIGNGLLRYNSVTDWTGSIALDLDFLDLTNSWTEVNFGSSTPPSTMTVTGDNISRLLLTDLQFGSSTKLSIDYPGASGRFTPNDWKAVGGEFDQGRSGILGISLRDPNTVPEPAAVTLLALGMLGLGWARKHHR